MHGPAILTLVSQAEHKSTALERLSDGHELFYLAADGELMSVELTPGRESHPGTPKPLFQANSALPWRVTAEGQRFLFAIPSQQNRQSIVTIVLNWMSALKN